MKKESKASDCLIIEDSVEYWLQVAGRYPLLSKREERELFLRYRNGERHLKKIIAEANLRMVVFIAKFYATNMSPISDLIQEGNIALLESIDRFDPEKNCRFMTYAAFWVRQAIDREVKNHGRVIKLPVYLQEFYQKLVNASDILEGDLQHAPTVEELAEDRGINPEYLLAVLRAVTPTISLEEKLSDHEDLNKLIWSAMTRPNQ